MINFDSSHKSIEGNLNKKKGKEWFKRILAAGLIIFNLVTFTGCAKTVDCDIEDDHAHYYVSQEEDIGRYVVSEKYSISGLDRTDEFIYVTPDEAELLEFMNKKDLYRIDENIDAIKEIEQGNKDFLEYRYKYIYLQPIPIAHPVGKTITISYSYIPVPMYSWTTNTNRNLTGETRVCHHMYYGYRVYQDEKGKYRMEKSELVDDISELPPEYQYISGDFTKIVNPDTKDELDYEDGTENDKGDEEVQEMMEEYEIVEDTNDSTKGK